MGSSDPELRMRQLATLRAAYDAGSTTPDQAGQNRIARHSRVLLGRILVALSGPPGCGGPQAIIAPDKACGDT